MDTELNAEFEGPNTWSAGTLADSEWLFVPSAKCIDEILELGSFLDDNPLPVEALLTGEFDLPECRRFIAPVNSALRDGARFAFIDRLPLDELGEYASIRVYWILMSMIARPVAQKQNGTLLFTVQDEGQEFKPGSGIRPAVTNMEQHFHNDNCFNNAPPEYVTLLCIHPAPMGGLSRVVSLTSVHNQLKKKYPDLLDRLYQPFYFDRQKEHLADDVPYILQPIFQYDGRLRARVSPSLVRSGYAVKGEEIDSKGDDALNALLEIFDDKSLWHETVLERGQINIANNQETGHSRTSFVDDPNGEKRRLERLWLRDAGKRTYFG
jgi:alpha-ketoglutarate-dependent taurine dioxygenase